MEIPSHASVLGMTAIRLGYFAAARLIIAFVFIGCRRH